MKKLLAVILSIVCLTAFAGCSGNSNGSSSALSKTDAPYLAPVPYRGKINHSILMQETCAVVAQVHRIGSDEMAEITYKNACKLFDIE